MEQYHENKRRYSLITPKFLFGFLTVQMLLLATCKEQAAQGSITEVRLTLPGGKEVTAVAAGNATAQKAILLVHDWFGMSDFVRQTLRRFEERGFYVLAIDLYGGESATTHRQAFALMQAVNAEHAAAIMKAGIEFLKASGRKIAVTGFSMGVTYALEATLASAQDVAATVLIYGTPILEKERLAALQSPVLAITGSKDNPKELFSFLEVMEGIDKQAEIYIYPGAKHAYAQPLFNGGKNLDETATRLTWQLTDDFLRRHLGE